MYLRRSINRSLGLAFLLAAGLAFSAREAHATDHVDGYLSSDGSCMVLQQHDGEALALTGDIRGLRGGDHVRLEGYLGSGSGRCGAPSFNLTLVQALWGDDRHQTTYFDHLNGRPFLEWAQQDGRVGYERRQSEERRQGGGYGYRDERDRRPQGSGYVYRGPHRRLTLVGRLDLSQGGCPVLVTENADFPLDGSLGRYQHGDHVRVDGYFYDQDPNAPCGATVVVRGIRGH